MQQLAGPADPALSYPGAGEQESIQMARQLRADALIIDDKKGRAKAARRNLLVIGTLGVLATAAERNLLDLSDAIQHLRKTNFHVSPLILKALLDRFKT